MSRVETTRPRSARRIDATVQAPRSELRVAGTTPPVTGHSPLQRRIQEHFRAIGAAEGVGLTRASRRPAPVFSARGLSGQMPMPGSTAGAVQRFDCVWIGHNRVAIQTSGRAPALGDTSALEITVTTGQVVALRARVRCIGRPREGSSSRLIEFDVLERPPDSYPALVEALRRRAERGAAGPETPVAG